MARFTEVALVALALAVGLAAAAPAKPDCKEDSEYFDRGPDCYKYIHCSKGAVEFKECPRDKFWNQAKGDCDLKENVSDCPGGRASSELNAEQSDENSEESVKVKPSEWRSPHGWCWGWAIPVQPVCTSCVVKQKPRPPPKVRPPTRPPTRRPPPPKVTRAPQVCATCVVPVQPVVPLIPVVQPTLVATPRITYEYRWVTGYHSGWYGRHYVAVPMRNGVQVTNGEQGEGAGGEQGEGVGGEQGEAGGEQGEAGGEQGEQGEAATRPEGEQGDNQSGADQGDHAKGDADQTKAEGEQGDHSKAEGEQGDHSKPEEEHGEHAKENEQGEHSGEQPEQPGELRQEANAKKKQ